MFQRVQKIAKPRADRSMMQTSTVARKLSAACIFAGWWDRRKPWHYWPRIRGSWPRANLSTLLRGPLRTYGSRISRRFRAFSWWEELRYAYDGLRVEAWAFRWSTWKRKKKRKPHVRWEHVFSLMLEPLSRVERKRGKERGSRHPSTR